MPATTFPNQRTITINREKATYDFLGIKNYNWQYAARDLGAHCLMLYLYLASNANGFKLALSPAAICNSIGMPRSTYRDQFEKLINKGYLIPKGGNSFDFFELPQTRHAFQQQENQNELTTNVDENVKCTSDDIVVFRDVHNIPSDITQININTNSTNNGETNKNDVFPLDSIYIPKVKEIRIPVPKAEPKKEKFIF